MSVDVAIENNKYKQSLDDELNEIPQIGEKIKQCVKNFMMIDGLESLDEVGIVDVYRYKNYVREIVGLKPTQKKYYLSGMEQLVYAHSISHEPLLEDKLKKLNCNTAVKNRVGVFLILSGKLEPSKIDYDLRCAYSEYLDLSVAKSKKSEYMKAFDKLKLNFIKENNKFGEVKRIEDDKCFLLYFPSYEIANSFYYVQDKEELLFDFSICVEGKLKRQIQEMLLYILTSKKNRHDRRERFIIPLRYLYHFCLVEKIEDIEKMTDQQEKAFKKYLSSRAGSKLDVYMQIIDNTKRFLFISSPEPNWEANVWFLERFEFRNGRSNPAREIRSVRFDDIENSNNRFLLKEYMRYNLMISQKESIQTIRCIFYGIHSYLRYLDDLKIDATKIESETIEAFVRKEDEKNNKVVSYNKTIMSVTRFYRYLNVKGYIQKMPFYSEYYLKKSYDYHVDREVDVETQFKILNVLKTMPKHLRLMYLNLWCVGLRVTEVCTLKAGMYSWDGKDAWLKTYQNKMKSEKDVPIPNVLYRLMDEYIKENNIKAGEYIFKNKKGGAYDAGTFSKQFKKAIANAGIVDYSFRAHDFRHTVASFLYKNGASIEVIRDFLGHKESDMTRKYIDYIAEIIDADNEKYFLLVGNTLAKEVVKGLEKNEKKDIDNGT